MTLIGLVAAYVVGAVYEGVAFKGEKVPTISQHLRSLPVLQRILAVLGLAAVTAAVVIDHVTVELLP